jgi:5-methylthioribose kinase
MIELRKIEAWDAYLPGLLFSRLGLRIDDYEIELVDSGKMNFVFRVRTEKGAFFLKQALNEVRAGKAMGPALGAISAQRLEYERNCIAEIRAILPDGVEIPPVPPVS